MQAVGQGLRREEGGCGHGDTGGIHPDEAEGPAQALAINIFDKKSPASCNWPIK